MIDGFHHVKLPVTDVARSSHWYQRVLGLWQALEFHEDGQLMGVILRDASEGMSLGLRCEPDRAAVLRGYDPVAFAVATRARLEAWRERLEGLGEPHGGIVTGHSGCVLVGLYDPDGIELRFYTEETSDEL
ncbi:VOC family protein [Nonomuraea sp. 3N208]|uniref:VOC family protein n=1 Tax=Nonomuraea sp. 3N208 TaxID=3457421 RepID=UPI003FD2763B